MARCCWAKRLSFDLQTEKLQGERETYPNDLRRLLATVCDRGCDTVERVLIVVHMKAISPHASIGMVTGTRVYGGIHVIKD